jgi:hypothetical protein
MSFFGQGPRVVDMMSILDISGPRAERPAGSSLAIAAIATPSTT